MRRAGHTMRQSIIAKMFAITAALLMVYPAVAQNPTATISGVVKDSSGAVVPGATVTVTNTDTGLNRSGMTAADGAYKFPALPVGKYEIRAEHPGFQSTIQSGLTLGLGQEAVINITLQVGAVEQTVAVTAEAPMIETTSANVSGLVSETQVRDLPLNARNLVELATLFPGVTIAREAGQGVPNGFATKLTIMGTRYNSSLFQLDGADINDATGSAGGAAGILMGAETVKEFNVVTSGYSAEYGKHTGGVFNAVTKSGTNSIHGSAFEFLRNAKLDARNFFDGRVTPPYKRNQFGGSLGGPIKKDRTFYFGSYEGLRERLGTTERFNVPSISLRNGFLPGQAQPVTINPKVKPFLDSYSIPNGTDFGNGTGQYVRSAGYPTNENFFTIRADHRISDKDSIFGRYTMDKADKRTTTNFNTNTLNTSKDQYVALGETRLFSAQVINVFLAAFNRSVLAQAPFPLPEFTSSVKSFTDREGPIGNIVVTGLSTWGAQSTTPSKALSNTFQFKDDVFYTKGIHSFKFGFNAERFQYLRNTFFNGGGQFNFSSLGAFLAGTVNRFTGMPRGSDPSVYPRQSLFGLYAQDDVRISSKLTLNLGLRYEFITVPNILHGRISNLPTYLTPGQTEANLILGNPMFLNPSLKNFAPRIGFAWDPTGTGKTSVRGGVGIFYDQVLAGPFLFSYVSTPPFFRNADIFATSSPSFPDAWYVQQNLLVGQSQIEPFQYKANQPTIYKYSLDLQQAVFTNTSLEAGFTGTRGVHLFRAILTNMPIAQQLNGRLFIPSTAPLTLPAFGRVRPKQSDVTSDYYGLRLGVNQRMTRGLLLRASYTFSKSIDDGTNFAGSLDFGNQIGQARYLAIKDRGLSAFDIRHALTVNSTYDLPGAHLAGAAGKLLGGWQMSGILNVQSGTPFDATSGVEPAWMSSGFVGDFPDRVAGVPIQYNTRNPDRYFSASAFSIPGAPASAPNTANPGFVGNAGRSSLIGPGIAQLNIVLSKKIQLFEKLNMQFRSEFYNLLNRANFRQPTGTGAQVFDPQTRGINRIIGQIVSTGSNTSRQIQFGLRLEF